MHEGSKRAILAAFLANLGIAIAKFVGFLSPGRRRCSPRRSTRSPTPRNQGLLFLGGAPGGAARRRPSTPSGTGATATSGRSSSRSSCSRSAACSRSTRASRSSRDPHEIELARASAFVILGVAIVARGVLPPHRRHGDPSAVKRRRHRGGRFIRRSKSPELPVVLLEDLGALLGLLLALAGVTLAVVDRRAAAGTASAPSRIGVLLVVIAVILAVEMKSLLIGESATPELQTAHRRRDRGRRRRAQRLIHMRTQHLGPDELLVAAKIELAPTLTAAGIAAAINATEARVRAAVPIARVIYLEPDLCAEAGPRRPPPPGA